MLEQIIDTSNRKQIVMFIDYDVTLSSIVVDPDRAFMPETMAQVPDYGVPLEASGLPKPPDLAHHLENASEPVHIESVEMAGDNISEEIVGKSCHIKCKQLSEERYLLIDVIR
ncbi:hypothetical protein GQ457_09G028690 [Hibiscus cannabinus]